MTGLEVDPLDIVEAVIEDERRAYVLSANQLDDAGRFQQGTNELRCALTCDRIALRVGRLRVEGSANSPDYLGQIAGLTERLRAAEAALSAERAAREAAERERDELLDAAKHAVPPAEYPREKTAANWAWCVRLTGDDRVATYRKLERTEAEVARLREALTRIANVAAFTTMPEVRLEGIRALLSASPPAPEAKGEPAEPGEK